MKTTTLSKQEIIDNKKTTAQTRAFKPAGSAFVQLTAEEARALLKSAGIQYFEGAESRIMQYTLTDETVDRMGDIVKAAGVQLDNYRKNPVVLAFHNGRSLPVGSAVKVWYDPPTESVKGWILFLDDTIDKTGFSDTVFRMAKVGVMNGGSIGFNAVEVTIPSKEEREVLKMTPYGVIFNKSDLIEWSVTPTPANPSALQDKGLQPHHVRSLVVNKALDINHSPIAIRDTVGLEEDDDCYTFVCRPLADFDKNTLEFNTKENVVIVTGVLESKEACIHCVTFNKSDWAKEDVQKEILANYVLNEGDEAQPVESVSLSINSFTTEEAIKEFAEPLGLGATPIVISHLQKDAVKIFRKTVKEETPEPSLSEQISVLVQAELAKQKPAEVTISQKTLDLVNGAVLALSSLQKHFDELLSGSVKEAEEPNTTVTDDDEEDLTLVEDDDSVNDEHLKQLNESITDFSTFFMKGTK